MSETAIDPRHPSRLEKKANTVAVSSSFTSNAVVINRPGEKNSFVARFAQGGDASPWPTNPIRNRPEIILTRRT